MSDFRISTVIPAYKAAKTIGRALNSVLTQTRPPHEILVIDDGSPDDLPAAMAGFGDQVTLIRQPNAGAASARNHGIQEAKGDLIAFLDADDFWEPTKLERQLEVFHRHPQVGLVASRYFSQVPGQTRYIDGEWEPIYNQILSCRGKEAFYLSSKIFTSTLVVRREVIGDCRFYCGLEPAEDRDLWVQLVVAAPIFLIGDPLATAVLEPGSLSRSSVDIDCSNMLRVVHRNKSLLGRTGLREWEGRVYRQWAAGHLGNGQPRAAVRPAYKRLFRQPYSPEAWWILLKSVSLSCAAKRQKRQNSIQRINASH